METTVGVGEKRGGREEAEDLGLGFGSGSGSSPLPPQKLNRTADFPFRIVEPYLCPSSTSSPKSSSGPTFFYSGSTSDFYDGARVLQPFYTPFKSLDMEVGAGAGAALPLGVFPFTSAQWQELQRQALIYKHIMASVPVPHDLLFPISARSFPETPPFHLPPTLDGGGGGACFSLRLSNSTDPEPGRCRRTDGKKWRCSRDVAPDQKYCERHLHRGRPRSRKPVELRKTKPTLITNTTNTLATAVAIDQSALSKPFSSQSTGFLTKADLKFPFQSMEPNKEPRCLDWMKGGTEDMASNQQWELMHSNIRLRSDTAPVLQHYEDRLNLNYTDLNDHCCPFLNPNLSSIKENAVADHGEPPRRLIDAWSIENTTATTNPDDSSSVPTNDKLLPSTLTLSMSGGVEEGTDHIQMGLGLADTGIKSQPLNWIAPASPFGGPLAEVLQSSNMTSPHNSCSASSKNSYIDLINLMCKSCRGSHDLCPQDSPTRLVSSPSGVLQKALVSPSDSSSSSSPTFAAASRSEMAVQWMNQTK